MDIIYQPVLFCVIIDLTNGMTSCFIRIQGGALLPDRWRAEVDAVLASVAMGAATGTASLIFDEDSTYMDGGAPVSSGAFQVAAYRALLSSLLSPCCHRPPYLAQGLAIFRKGARHRHLS